MKKSVLFIFLVSILFVSCKENEPTAPEEETPTGELVAEANIGPEGGTLETEDFELTIPSGAFDQVSELKLYTENRDSSNENSATPLYVIEGIPENYIEPMEVRIRYVGSASGILYIERGMEVEIIDFDTTYIDNINELFDAVDDNGFLKTTLPINQSYGAYNHNKRSDDKKKITIGGFINGALESSDHFKIKSVDFPVSKWGPQYQTVLEYFESSYNRMKSLGFELDRSDWPKIITIENKVVDLKKIKVYLGRNLRDLSIRSHPGLDISDENYQCDSYLCWLVLYAYKIPAQFENILWGISSWTTHKYDSYWNSLSDSKWIKIALFRVLNNYDSNNSLAIILEYLVNKYGINILNQIMLDVKAGKNPILAIISNTEESKHWLSNFHKSILIEDLWLKRIRNKDPNYSMVDFCKENWSAEFGIEDTTTVIEWTETYKDLSAKLYRVNLLPGLGEESGLKFTVDGGDAEISLFKYKGSEIEFITSSEKSDSVSNIKNLADNGYQLIALVSNQMPNYPNFSTSNIELKIEHKNVKPLPKITSCAISLLDIDVNIRKYWDDGTYTDDVYERFWTFFYPEGEPAPEPTFENNIFSQAYTFTDNQGFNVMGNMSIEFNKDLDTILTFSANYNIDKTVVNPLYGTLEESISGQDIPLIHSYYNDEYTVTGLEVCEVLNDLKHSQTGGGSVEYDIISIKECRPDSDQWPSRLTIKITKE